MGFGRFEQGRRNILKPLAMPLLCVTMNLPEGLILILGSHFTAGWSSPVARQAHNLKAAGSNPAPATN
jgi:hypothetical protein